MLSEYDQLGQMFGYDSPQVEEYMREHNNPAVSDFIDNIGIGLKNAFYEITGQHEKTTTYQYEQHLDDTKNQRLAEDLKAAGLSKYGMTSSAPSGGGYQSSVPKGLQKIAAMIDIAKARAEVANVQADTGVKNAEAAATTAGIGRDDAYYKLAAAKNDSDIARNECLNQLTKNQSAQVAEETLAIIDKRVRDNESHLYDMVAKSYDNLLKLKDIGSYDERLKADLSLKGSSTYLNQMKAGEALEHSKLYQEEIGKIQKEIERIASEIANDEAYRNHLSYEDQLLVEDTAYRQLQYNIAAYNARYSAEVGLRTTDASTYISGLNTSQLGKLGSNILLGNNPASWFGFRGTTDPNSLFYDLGGI